MSRPQVTAAPYQAFKFKVGDQLLATVKDFKYKRKPVKIVSQHTIEKDDGSEMPYYKVSGEGIHVTISIWEQELEVE